MRPYIEPFGDRDEVFKHLPLPNFAGETITMMTARTITTTDER